METEEIFLIFSALMLFFDLVLLSKVKEGEKSRLEYGFYAATLACALVVASYLLLVQAFLNNDFGLVEVFSYSSSGLSMASKIYATWSGASTSMLFLTFMIAVAYFVYRFRTYSKGSATNVAAYKMFNVVVIFFIFLILMNSPFQRLPIAPKEGGGLNPLLQTFWMFAHPPIVFAGYVFIILAFVLTLARMSTQESVNSRSLKMLLQAAWLTTTLGIAIGGLWAYEVLGWGGYWAWDAVETASLLPWLALTAYFHLGVLSKAGKSLTREVMLLITFASLIFATALTRGGLLQSVHAFGSSAMGPILILFVIGFAVYFFYLNTKKITFGFFYLNVETKKPFFSLTVDKTSLNSVSFYAGFWSIIFIFLICFWGLAFPIVAGAFLSSSMTTGAAFYYNWTFPFAMAFVAAMVGCSLSGKTGFKKFIVLLAGALAVGVFLAFLRWPTPNVLANLGIPLLAVGFSAALYKMISVLPENRRSMRQFGRSLLHLAIIITLIGVFLSTTTKQESVLNNVRPNTRVETLGLTIDLKNFTVYTSPGHVYYMQGRFNVTEYSALKMDITIHQGDRSYSSALWTRLYALSGVVSTPLIITTPTGDIYVRMLQTQNMTESLLNALDDRQVLPEYLSLSVDFNPAVYLVWTGVGLMSIGIGVPLTAEILRGSPKKVKS